MDKDQVVSAAGQSADKAHENVARLYRMYQQTLISKCHMSEDQMIPEEVFVQQQFTDKHICDISELIREKNRRRFLFLAYWELLGQAPEEWVVRKREKDTSPIEEFQMDLLYTLLHSSAFQNNDVEVINNPWEGRISGRQRFKNVLTAIYRHLPRNMRDRIDRIYWR